MIKLKKILIFLVPLIFVFTKVWSLTTPQVSTVSKVTRLSGDTRYKTSIEILNSSWKESKNLVLASGEDFPDALCSVSLAKQLDAPILLVEKSMVSEETITKIKDLKVQTLFIIGGEASISKTTEDALRKIPNISITRLSGSNRYETSVTIANYIHSNFNTGSEIVITSGLGFADALSIAPIAAKKGMPIILSSKDTLSDTTKTYLSEKKITKSYVVGGLGVISDSLLSKFPGSERIAGADRYDTNIDVINHFGEYDYTNVYTASGENFPDALSGAAVAAKNSSFIVLTPKTPGNKTKGFLYSLAKLNSSTKNIVVLGGAGVVPDETIEKLTTREEDYLGNVINGLSVSYNNGYIYYRKPSDNYALYRVKADGSGNIKLANQPLASTNIVGNTMYYSVVFGNDHGIYKSNIDGTNKVKLSSSYPRHMQLDGDWLYYTQSVPDTGGGELCKIKIDGTNEMKIHLNLNESYSIEVGLPFCVKEGWIYTNMYILTNPVKPQFAMIRTDGSTVKRVTNKTLSRFQPVYNWIFYSDIQGIHKVKNDGTEDTLLTSVERKDGGVYSINIYNDYIYYTVTEFGGTPEQIGLFKVKLDGSENTKLTDHVARYLWTVPGWIYFDTGGNEISRIKLDGTGLEQV